MNRRMNDIQRARSALAQALDEIKGLAVYTRLGDVVDPPAVMVSLPRVEFNGPPGVPTDATFTLPVFARMEGDTSDDLSHWMPIVVDMIENTLGIPVRSATPGTWPAGGVDLPAYLIEAEVALPWQ
jgi:hypothetical protein